MKKLSQVLILLCCVAGHMGPAQASIICPLVLAGDFPVTYIAGRIPVITVKVGNATLNMMVDSGAGISSITNASWKRLGGPPFRDIDGSYGIGVGGSVQYNTGLLEDVDTGHALARDQAFIVSDAGVPAHQGKPLADGVLGYDFLDTFDVAFDMPHNRLSLYFYQHCDTAEAPWPGNYDVEALQINRTHLNTTIPYAVDATTMRGMIDSGAFSTLVSQDSLDGDGIKPAEIMDFAGSGRGLGGRGFTYHLERFDTVGIGAEQFGNVWLKVGKVPLGGMADVLVGEDYLWTHQVFISNSTQTALFGLFIAKRN